VRKTLADVVPSDQIWQGGDLQRGRIYEISIFGDPFCCTSPDDRGMVLRVFEKSAHTKPVLALYKSLLKLSSNKSLDPVLTARLQRRIRNGFRKNQKIFSARLVKTNLINAFNVRLHHPALANRRYIPS
jgi:hypothetical protein